MSCLPEMRRPLLRRWLLWVFLAAVLGLNFALLLIYVRFVVLTDIYDPADWTLTVAAGQRMLAGSNPYEDILYRYSPLLAAVYAFAAPLSVWFWRALIAGALLLLPRHLMLIGILLWPFWADFQLGNTMTFAAVSAVLAVRGNAWGQAAFLVVTALVPRPLMFPVAAWIAWKRRDWWPLLVAALAAYLAAVFATGWGVTWVERLAFATTDLTDYWPGPATLLGPLWIVVAVPMTMWLMASGRLGLASLAAQPYWVHYYGLMLLLELRQLPSAWSQRLPGFAPRGRRSADCGSAEVSRNR